MPVCLGQLCLQAGTLESQESFSSPETLATIFLRIPLSKNAFKTLEKNIPEL